MRPLLQHFIKKIDPSLALTPEAWAALDAYRWPGNVRELQNVVEQLSALGVNRPIEVRDLPWYSAGAPLQLTGPTRDRRRRVADTIFERITTGPGNFWVEVCERFMNRDLTRQDVRDVIARGLDASGGNYRELLRLFRMDTPDYKRLLNFLVRHDCTVYFRAFRGRADMTPRRPPGSPVVWPPSHPDYPSSIAG